MKITFLLFLFSLLLLANPHKSEESLHIERGSQDSIVVIFQKAAPSKKKQEGSFFTADHVHYFDDSGIPMKYTLDNFGTNDTLQIPAQGDVKGVELFYNYVRFQYVFIPGDTVLFTFPDDIPEAKSLHKKIPDAEVNFHKLVKIEFSETLKNNNLLAPAPRDTTPLDRQLTKVIADHTKRHENLQKLEAQGRISERNQLVLADMERARFYTQITSPSFKDILFLQVDKNSMLHFANRKDLFGQPFFHHFLMYGYLRSPLLAIREIRLAQSRRLDFKDAYDKIKAQMTDPDLRDWLLYYCVDKLGTEGTKDEFQEFLKRLQEDTGNIAYVNHISNSHGAEIQATPGGKTLLTNYGAENSFEFSDLLTASKGQLVYVDLWASWCMPCRAAMPASKALQNEFTEKEVRFIYVSLDQKMGDWKKAITEEKLENHPHSYLLLDPREAELVKNMGIRTIPRYLLYGKDGEIIHQNAPGPDSPELKELLKKYLN